MPLLPDELKVRLPPLQRQGDDLDPVVYARLHLPGTSSSWYLIEGEAFGEDFVLYCFFSSDSDYRFDYFRLSALEITLGPQGQPVVLDPEFPEGRLTDVVPAPDL